MEGFEVECPVPISSLEDSQSSSGLDDSTEEQDAVGSDPNNESCELLSSRVKLRLYARHLRLVGLTKRLPDCFAEVILVDGPLRRNSSFEKVVGKTEIIDKDCNPQWTSVFTLDYVHGVEKYFFVRVMRLNKSRTDNKLVGGALFEIGDVLGSNRAKARRFKNGGCVIVQLRVMPQDCQDAVFRAQFRTVLPLRLPRFMSNKTPDTTIELAKKRVTGAGESWVTVYRSLPVENSDKPEWDEINVDFETLCNGDLEWPVRIGIRERRKKSHRLLGVCETTLHALLDALVESDKLRMACSSSSRDDGSMDFDEAVSEKDMLLLNPSTRLRSSDTVVANLRVVKAVVLTEDDPEYEASSIRSIPERQPSVLDAAFVSGCGPESCLGTGIVRNGNNVNTDEIKPLQAFHDYVRSNQCDIDLSVAIDFTSSNGDPYKPGSLHQLLDDNNNALNDYEEAIQVVGEALSEYSTSQEFAVWGFGAKYDGEVRHLFQCGETPTTHGVDGILKAYRSVFTTDFIMSGPTMYDPVLRAAAGKARACHKVGLHHRFRYQVLLIITDGVAIDLEETKRKAMIYSQFPLSIIIVGVGRSDFRHLYELRNTSGTSRQIITVVEFRKHQQDPSALANAALCNLPSQIYAYMQQSGIDPVKACSP